MSHWQTPTNRQTVLHYAFDLIAKSANYFSSFSFTLLYKKEKLIEFAANKKKSLLLNFRIVFLQR